MRATSPAKGYAGLRGFADPGWLRAAAITGGPGHLAYDVGGNQRPVVRIPRHDGACLREGNKCAPRQQRESLLEYEHKLLEGLADCGPASSLPALAAKAAPVLSRARTMLVHEAVRRGWLRHLHHDQRTAAGEELARQVRSFQRVLRQLKAERGQEALAGSLLPYALHFGLVTGSPVALAQFANAWMHTFADLPGWQPPAAPRREFDDYALSKPSIDEQMLQQGAALWLLGNC